MNCSESLNDIAAALAKAQPKIKTALKGAENPFFKSTYADLPAVMDACRDALNEQGIAVVQLTDFDADGVWLDTMLVHASGQWMSGRYPVRPVKNDPQGVGSAITYARRYALAAAAGVVAATEDDDGNAASGRGSNGDTVATADQHATLHDMIARHQVDAVGLATKLGLPQSLKGLTRHQIDRAIEAINARNVKLAASK